MADVSADLKNWSTTASSNSPSDATTVGAGLADNLQEIQKVVRQDLAHKGADIASAGTTDLGAVTGLMHDITGTTTITSFGTVSAGIWKIIKFEGALTLTHNASSLILPGGVSIKTAVGDVAFMMSEGSGNWRCLAYTKPHVYSFKANKNGTDQTGIASATDTKLTFGTELWDTGGWYDTATSRYTPLIAGNYRFKINALISANVVDQAQCAAIIYKNGGVAGQNIIHASGSAAITVAVDALISMNGTTDYVEAYVYGGGAGNKTVSGVDANTYFEGMLVERT